MRADLPRRVLMVAYHFPPLAGSSGIQRTLRFVQHLPALGWEPLVLSAQPHAYERCSDDLMHEVPPATVVKRAFALDTARHLSIRGRYLGALGRPDRWTTWRFDAIRTGMRMIREYRPQAIWSTYPIATAHLIGAELQRRSGLPWIADFRDPMAQDGYPADRKTWQQFMAIEGMAMRQAAACCFTTPGAARIYRQRYPQAAARIHVLENGYDEHSFADAAPPGSAEAGPLNQGALTLLHSGIVYPAERDPTQLFAAIATLRAAGTLRPGALKVRFRAAVHDDLLRMLAESHGVLDCIELMPAIGYRQALQEMLHADALLVLQAANCNEQIPAKLYEYLRARRPIVCLSDPAGDTVSLLRKAGVGVFARLDNATDIAELLAQFLAARSDQASFLPSPGFVAGASRLARTQELVSLLDSPPSNS